jgi:hypothetical protein
MHEVQLDERLSHMCERGTANGCSVMLASTIPNQRHIMQHGATYVAHFGFSCGPCAVCDKPLCNMNRDDVTAELYAYQYAMA